MSKFLTLLTVLVFLVSCAKDKNNRNANVDPQQEIQRKQKILRDKLKEKFKEEKIKQDRLNSKDQYIDLIEGIYSKEIALYDKYIELIENIHRISNDGNEIQSILDNYYFVEGNSTIEDADIIFIGDIHMDTKVAFFNCLLINHLLLQDESRVVITEGANYNPDDDLSDLDYLISIIFASIDYYKHNQYYNVEKASHAILKQYGRFLSFSLDEPFQKHFENFRIPILNESRCIDGDLISEEVDFSCKERNKVLIQAIRDQIRKNHKVIVLYGGAHLVTYPYKYNLQHLWRFPNKPDIEEQIDMTIDDFYALFVEKDTADIYKFLQDYRYVDILTGNYQLN